MVKILWLLLSLCLIILILIRIPNNGGLNNFSINVNIIGSPNSAEKFLNQSTWLLIFLYLCLAIKFNSYSY